jgi:hypothetical protein
MAELKSLLRWFMDWFEQLRHFYFQKVSNFGQLRCKGADRNSRSMWALFRMGLHR